jgi:hypothetical protein
MARQFIPRSQYGWRWCLVIFAGLAWLSIGCSPQTLTMFMLPFSDNLTQPQCKDLFANSKEVTLVILANFIERPFRPDYVPADQELAESVTQGLRKRIQGTKNTIKFVPQSEVRSYYLKQLSEDGDTSPMGIGKKFNADFVLDLSIDKFGLYQEKMSPPVFQGTARINVRLFNMKPKDGQELPFKETYLTTYSGPRGVIMEVGNRNPADFRQMFLSKMGQEISRYFIAFDAEELKSWD